MKVAVENMFLCPECKEETLRFEEGKALCQNPACGFIHEQAAVCEHCKEAVILDSKSYGVVCKDCLELFA